jgi:hypothetical protein
MDSNGLAFRCLVVARIEIMLCPHRPKSKKCSKQHFLSSYMAYGSIFPENYKEKCTLKIVHKN